MHVRRRRCARLYECMHLGACPDICLGCFEGLTEWVWEGVILPRALGGPQVGKAVGEWALVHWWMGLRMRVILISCYDSPLPTQVSPLSTRIESPCTHNRSLSQTHTLQHLPDTEGRGQEVRGVAELGRKRERRNERRQGLPCMVLPCYLQGFKGIFCEKNEIKSVIKLSNGPYWEGSPFSF